MDAVVLVKREGVSVNTDWFRGLFINDLFYRDLIHLSKHTQKKLCKAFALASNCKFVFFVYFRIPSKLYVLRELDKVKSKLQSRMAVRYGTFRICVLRTSHLEPYRTSVPYFSSILKRTVPTYRTRTMTKKRTVPAYRTS